MRFAAGDAKLRKSSSSTGACYPRLDTNPAWLIADFLDHTDVREGQEFEPALLHATDLVHRPDEKKAHHPCMVSLKGTEETPHDIWVRHFRYTSMSANVCA